MTELPPLMRDQRKVDAEHLRLLSLFHFVTAGLALVGLGLLFLHWMAMHLVFASPDLWKDSPGGPPPRDVLKMMKWMYLSFGLLIVFAGALNAVSGWLIRKRRARPFSLLVAGLDCMGFPLVTTLGVFTFLVLLRESVVDLYRVADARKAPPPPPEPTPAA